MDLRSLSLSTNLVLFVVAATAVWFAGTRLARYAHAMSDRTGWDKAFLGLALLAIATELPELAATLTASAADAPDLALMNMFGGITMQTAILAVADATLATTALTAFVPRAVILLQGAALVVVLALTLCFVAIGEVLVVFGVGLWPLLLFGAYLGALQILRAYDRRGRWKPVDPPTPEESVVPQAAVAVPESWTLKRLCFGFTIATLVVLAAGVVLASSASALAVQTGLGENFLGATLLATSTSLPELSTTITAVRLGAYSMAIANIFGSNLVMVALILPADIAFRGGAILEEADGSAFLLLASGILVTAIYLIGLIERRNRTLLGMGADSLAVLVAYGATLVALYFLR